MSSTTCLVEQSNLYSKGSLRKDLIQEMSKRGRKRAIYTMKPYNHNGLISLPLVYMECSDEYEFAFKVFGSYANFEEYLKEPRFVKGPHENDRHQNYQGLTEWRREKELKDKSAAKSLLWQSAKKGSVAAQKLLYEGDKQAGRPSKEKVAKEATRRAEEEKILSEGWERVRKLKLVEGNG